MSKKVSLARVDKELLRATTNMNWNLTAVDYVVVVGADYVNDPFTESIMQLCLPNIIRVKILRKEDLSAFLQKDEGRKEARVMIIFKDLATAEQLSERDVRWRNCRFLIHWWKWGERKSFRPTLMRRK